jgi:hypothetical protein
MEIEGQTALQPPRVLHALFEAWSVALAIDAWWLGPGEQGVQMMPCQSDRGRAGALLGTLPLIGRW